MKYELIKEYPGSLKLGTITEDIFLSTTTLMSCFPEFWQKVEEVDYEITEVKYANEIRFLHDGTYKLYRDGVGFKLDYFLKKNGATIHSVKRLSDGEVFTIGDEINGATYTNREIEEFILCGNSILILQRGGYSQLSDIQKPPKKTPLFTTEDGVDIFEGDVYWFSTDKSDINKDVAFKNMYLKGKYFSTLEKLEEYILLNKPLLSLNDISTVLNNTSPLFYEIKSLAEAKLNPKSKSILAQEYINNIETLCAEIKYSIKK